MTTVRTLGLDRLHLLGHRLAAGRHLHPAVERGEDVVGRHLLAVVELDAVPQRDGVDQGILRHRRQRLGQHGHDVRVGVVRVQELVDVLHDRADEVGRRGHRVERLRLADHRDVRDAASRRRGLRGRDWRGGEDQGRAGGRDPVRACPASQAAVAADPRSDLGHDPSCVGSFDCACDRTLPAGVHARASVSAWQAGRRSRAPGPDRDADGQ